MKTPELLKNSILKIFKGSIFLLLLLISQFSALFAQGNVVDLYGKLSVKGNYIMGEHGDTVQLRGMSLFWSQWMGQYYNADAIKWLKDDWKCTIVRAAMGVEKGGYLTNPDAEKEKVVNVVDAAIAQGLYVIIDYHAHEAHKDPEPAKKFFSEMAAKYGQYPNVLYEIYNEPLQDANWSKDIKPYAEAVIKSIREKDPDNIVIVGTRQWSQMVSEAAEDKLSDPNTVYTLHFYAATHKKWLRDEAKKALDKGVCLFVSEWGTCAASGNGKLDSTETRKWWDFMDQYKMSWCNWSIADKDETSAALMPGAKGTGGWPADMISPSGKFVREDLIKQNTPVINKKAKKPEKKEKAKKEKKKKKK
jgi:endoglucanase